MATASVMTYDSLVENIQSYLERSDTATLDKIPLFIMLAEQIIASQIKFLGNLTVNTSAMVQGAATIAKPARWHNAKAGPATAPAPTCRKLTDKASKS